MAARGRYAGTAFVTERAPLTLAVATAGVVLE
jgi:hypothetical protein